MSLDLSNSDNLDESFASFTLVSRGNIQRNRPHPRVDLIPTELPSGDRLEDSFGGSARYRPVSQMNSFEYGGVVPDIASVGDTDYESTPYGYTLNEEYSNFKFLGIGKESAKQKTRREARKKRQKEAKEQRKKMPFGKRFVNVFQKYNPAVAVPRSSALVGLRVNIFGIATKLYPALLTQEELIKRKFDLENAKKAKVAFDKVDKFWLSMGGSSAGLKNAIEKAYSKPIFKTKKAKARKAHEKAVSSFDAIYEDEVLDTFSSRINGDEQYSYFDPYSDVAIGAYISLGLSLLGMVSSFISKSGAKKNPYVEGSAEAKKLDEQLKTADIEAPTVTPEQVEELKKLQGLAQEDLDKGLGLDESTGELESNTILGMPKPAFYIGLGLLVLVGGYFAYKKFIKK